MFRRRRSGFTLIEILVIALLIALLAGLATFSAQTFYDSNRRKAIFAEVYQIGTALSWARDDLGFYPRLTNLSLPLPVLANREYLDNYGYFSANSPRALRVVDEWRGPYLSVSEARTRLGVGQRGLVQMILPDESGLSDPEWWPSDTFGNPYVVYQFTSDANYITSRNPLGLRLVKDATETANYFNAVVSYGANNVPGGNENTLQPANQSVFDELAAGMFYVEQSPGLFRLKTYTTDPGFFNTAGNDTVYSTVARPSPDPDTGDVGITDVGSDDIFFRF